MSAMMGAMMGETLALLSACCFAAANVSIMRGADAKGQHNGAFLSILLTAGIAAMLWLYQSMRDGWPALHAYAMLWFAGAGILTVLVGRVCLYASIQHLGALRASAVKRLNPLFAVMLGVLLLGESFDLTMLVGMLVIGASFGVLIWQALRGSGDRGTVAAAGNDTGTGTGNGLGIGTATSTCTGNGLGTSTATSTGNGLGTGTDAPARSWSARLGKLGFFYGPVSALAYAFGYVARKQGMLLMPDAAFGTMLGSVVGALVFVTMAQFLSGYRAAVRQTFSSFNPWQFASGLLASAGQLLYFAALSHSSISRVAVISSMEAFVTIFLTVVITRSLKQLNGPLLLAASLGVAGTMLIVLGR